ncbi:hypothetical protein CARUB_v10008492mg [Capsella rubella]|uniref:DUF7815 domain-containing protein n=1 Tax=Capsella rubella TaxID=81985 RepID=R0IMG4_9BRAS|nr:uncharacterized protein LOC17899013 [Capsella rubella]EOA39825.1 hypothetical protein CARUB_v10008492mg [Capsella rubella]
MPMEISLDLMNQLKVSLRKEAKLTSFDPVGDDSDSSSSGLPTSAEAIAELDASAPYLRCRNCRGKLLRGIESLICVFCGNQQRTCDNPPDPIKFTSTSAYKWFLSSLNLDGSEIVEPLKETNGSSRGAKAPAVKGIAVSKFLDLEIQWSATEDQSMNSGPDVGQSVQNKNPLNLGGISLDDFFVEGRGNLAKVDPAESKPVEDDDFKDPRSLSLFDSVKSPGVVGSQQHENVSLFKGKDVQIDVSSEEHENLSLFARRDAQESVSLAAQGNFGFFEEKDVRNSFKEDENLGLFAHITSSSKDDESFGLFDGKDTQRSSFSKEDENFGLFEGAPSSDTNIKSFDDKIVASSSDWDSDFQSADHNLSQKKIGGDPFVSSPADLSAHMDSVFGSGKDLLYVKPADSSTAYVSKSGDWLQDDLFGNVSGEAQNNDSVVHDKNEGLVVGGNGNSSMDIDWIGDDLWQTNEKKSTEKTPTYVNDDDDDWNDFASSTNSKTPNNPLSQTMESPQGDIFDGQAQVKNGVKEQNTGTIVMSDLGKGEEDDLFGTWDSLTSSTIRQTSLQPPTNHANPSGEKIPEMDLFGASNNHRNLDFDSISRSDFFSESIGGKSSSEEAKVIPLGTSTLDRTSDPDGSKDQTVDLVVGTTTTATKSKSEVAEELMSQMHDLSFMLETKLSVPPISKTE